MKSTKSIGDEGEQLTSIFLKNQGYEIIERNWRTRYCEIDIVAKKKKRVYFIEVKTRKSTEYGSGFDYITARKLKQMRFAAELWVSDRHWTGEYQLAAASVTDAHVEFIDEL